MKTAPQKQYTTIGTSWVTGMLRFGSPLASRSVSFVGGSWNSVQKVSSRYQHVSSDRSKWSVALRMAFARSARPSVRATMRGELRAVEAQLTATASLLSWARAARFASGEWLKATPISLTDL